MPHGHGAPAHLWPLIAIEETMSTSPNSLVGSVSPKSYSGSSTSGAQPYAGSWAAIRTNGA